MRSHISELRRFLVSLLLVGSPAALSAGLPDTGQSMCRDASDAMVPCAAANSGDASARPRQDGRYGWDAAALAGVFTKTGAGARGFDYTKVANDGTTLPASATLGTAAADWACTQDNISGLIWEVKTTDGQLRDGGWTYSWYDSVPTTNGGNAGTPNGGTCLTAGRCDSEKFAADVNAASLCGHNDWRVPTPRELLTLIDLDGSSPFIEGTYFPNTSALSYWASVPFAPSPGSAWYADFGSGAVTAGVTSSVSKVRLVRGTGF